MTNIRLYPDSEEFFNKYGFRLTLNQKHPIYQDEMEFKGLEANYVSRLESDIEHYKRALCDSLANNERLMSREHYRLHDEIEKLKHKASN